MNHVNLTVIAIGIFTLMTSTSLAQTPPQPELPKVGEPHNISIAFGSSGIGKILAADERGKVQQYLEEWENQAKEPNVITYVLIGSDGATFTATWGKGPINTVAFRCQPDTIPEFGEKVIWVATANKGELTFQEIKDDDIKGLFGNLLQARRDWGREVNAANQRSRANNTQINILGFMKEKNRKKWYEQGWLQPANPCVQHF